MHGQELGRRASRSRRLRHHLHRHRPGRHAGRRQPGTTTGAGAGGAAAGDRLGRRRLARMTWRRWRRWPPRGSRASSSAAPCTMAGSIRRRHWRWWPGAGRRADRSAGVQLQHFPRQIEAAADQHPGRRRPARQGGQRRRHRAAGPRDAAAGGDIASTGIARCCPGSATAQSVLASGMIGRGIPAPACRPSCRPAMQRPVARRPGAQLLRRQRRAGAGIVAAVEPQLPTPAAARGQPAGQALQAGRPFGAGNAGGDGGSGQPGRVPAAQRGDGHAGVVHLMRAGQRRAAAGPARPPHRR